jgi:SAM-dependent methyltransferase
MRMDFAEITRINGAFIESRILQTAVLLGIFDAVDDSATAEAVAARLDTDPRATGLLMNALVAMGLLLKHQGLFRLTPAAETYLRSDAPHSLTGLIRFDAALWEGWGHLPEAVRTGQPVRRPDMFQDQPQDTERFIRAMHSLVMARGDADIIVDSLELDGVERLLDIGSGPGTYPIRFCLKHPHLRATIFDLPGTLAVTRQFVDAAPCRDRIELVAGDFNRDPLPAGFGMAFLSNIIHGEDEDANQRLLRGVFAALQSGGRIVIKDHILDADLTSPAVGAIFSMQMLLFARGRDYGFDEVREWLQRAGFTSIGHRPLEPPLTSALVTAVKP